MGSERVQPIPRCTFLVINGLLDTSRKMDSLQCRRILGRRKLPVYARTVVNAIFDVMTQGE